MPFQAAENYAGFPDLAVTTLKPLLKPSQEALELASAAFAVAQSVVAQRMLRKF